ncbi:MAG TPA: RsmD family RNA methyltransferase [Gemmatimonadaceae bacterium]|nr:RsmD family RNA methyltransferase [Gemmatimonadaceae bacterium]
MIAAPPGDAVRPTTDRVREAWMSIVHPWLPGARVIDLFAGSGALGLEALSRGARSCDFVESSAKSLVALRANIDKLGAGDRSQVHRSDALRFTSALASDAFDVAFADPPYNQGLAAALAELWLKMRFAGVLGVEHAAREALPPSGDTRRYGTTAITFYGLLR